MPGKSQLTQATGNTDPTLNVREMFSSEILHIKELRTTDNRYNDKQFVTVADMFATVAKKFEDIDVKYQIQFTSAKEAVSIASTAQEKMVAQALEGTKEAITKNDTNTDKRFDLLSEKIAGVQETVNKSSSSQVIYVTHTDLSNEMEKLRNSFETMLRPVITFMNSQQGGEKSTNMVWVYITIGIGALGGITALILNALRLIKVGL